MKVSKKWLNDYVSVADITSLELADRLTIAGLEVEGIETLACRADLVIGEVLTCDRHPDSDHLSVTTVNLGDKVEQIVCGAPNVAQGQKVIVARLGAVLPQLTIKKAVVRGVESCG
jgi:phenylalanyl-tRNA synthetase beta chain